MTEPRLNAVDMSRWGGELTLEEALAMKALGVGLVIVGTGHPGGAGMFARQQARVADIAGLRVEAYIYLYMAGDAAEQVRQALATMEGLPVRRWWLDAEDVESPELSPADRRTFLHICVSILQGAKVPVGIYTGRWWWVPNMGDYDGFSPLPLWNSYYDGDPDTDGLPYGGWTESTIEQYQGTTNLCGQSVDLNYAKDLEEEENVDGVTLRDVVAALGGAQAIVEWNARGNSLLAGYALEQGARAAVEARLNEHIANHAAGIHDHTHTAEVKLR